MCRGEIKDLHPQKGGRLAPANRASAQRTALPTKQTNKRLACAAHLKRCHAASRPCDLEGIQPFRPRRWRHRGTDGGRRADYPLVIARDDPKTFCALLTRILPAMPVGKPDSGIALRLARDGGE